MDQEAVWLIGRFHLRSEGSVEFQWIHGTHYSVLATFDLSVLPTDVPVKIVAYKSTSEAAPVVRVLHIEALNDD